MSTVDVNLNNNDPKIVEQKDVIILSDNIECHCGRTKGRVHCPACGKAKMTGLVERVFAVLPDGAGVVKNCKVYRCAACAEKFNDVDWYFNCHAPRKIDLAATKKLQEERLKKYWLDRIQRMERMDYNTRTKCMAESGYDPWEMQQRFAEAQIAKSRPRAKVPQTNTEKIINLKDEIDNLEAWVKDHPEDLSSQKEIEQLKQELKELENQEN